MRRVSRRINRPTARRAFNMAEVAVATLLIAILLTAALKTVGASKASQYILTEKVLGQQLTLDLMSEILRQRYEGLNDVSVLSSDNKGTGSTARTAFDAVNDYANWRESPPRDRNGNSMAGFADWTRQVVIEWADPDTLDATTTAYTGIKRITVTTSHHDKLISSLIGYRTQAWTDTIPTPTDATGNHPPTAVATASETCGSSNLTTTLDGTGSSDADGDTLSYVWDFGDGTTASGISVTHSYTEVGSYNVRLTVYDGRGGVDTATVTVMVVP